MSRSIHETRQELEEVRRWELGGRDDEVWLVEDRLAAKRRYKTRSGRHRRIAAPAGAGAVEVITEPAEEHAHHPLDEDDIHALLGLLPADVRPVVRAVRRRTGLREDDMVVEDSEADPLTGRHGYEHQGGIWTPRLRGRFRPAAAEIDLFAFVYDERALRVPEVQTALLWLEQAETLAHEVAHAWDDSARTSGDRWALDEEGRAERYAEATAREWTGRHATAYFAHAHPERIRAYDEWIVRHAGIPIPLARVAGDLDQSYWGVHLGLYDLCAAWDDGDAPHLRTELAREYHFVDDFEPARQILELVLAEDPVHRDATILMGDIAVHEQDWDRALQWTDRALRLAPDDLDAHEDRVDALIGAGRWADAAAAASRALAVETPEDEPIRVGLRLERARCLIELGDFSGADLDLDVLIGGKVLRRAGAARALRAESLLRRGRWLEARMGSIDALAAGVPAWPAALLTAVAWEAAARLGGTGSAPVPTERHVELLRWNGRGAWVDRMLAMGMQPLRNKRTRRQAALQRRRVGHLTRM